MKRKNPKKIRLKGSYQETRLTPRTQNSEHRTETPTTLSAIANIHLKRVQATGDDSLIERFPDRSGKPPEERRTPEAA